MQIRGSISKHLVTYLTTLVEEGPGGTSETPIEVSDLLSQRPLCRCYAKQVAKGVAPAGYRLCHRVGSPSAPYRMPPIHLQEFQKQLTEFRPKTLKPPLCICRSRAKVLFKPVPESARWFTADVRGLLGVEQSDREEQVSRCRGARMWRTCSIDWGRLVSSPKWT